jgi:hypothetical protein
MRKVDRKLSSAFCIQNTELRSIVNRKKAGACTSTGGELICKESMVEKTRHYTY